MIQSLPIFPSTAPAPSVLKKLREDLGLSQSELAEALGFSRNKGPQTVRDWEAGEREGSVFVPTPLAWAALRYLCGLAAVYRGLTPAERADSTLRRLLPETLL